MPFYVQYDEEGNVTATVWSDQRPDRDRQLAFDGPVETANRKVVGGRLVEVAPPEES